MLFVGLGVSKFTVVALSCVVLSGILIGRVKMPLLLVLAAPRPATLPLSECDVVVSLVVLFPGT